MYEPITADDINILNVAATRSRMMGKAWNARQGYDTCECDKPVCVTRRRAERKRERRIEKQELRNQLAFVE